MTKKTEEKVLSFEEGLNDQISKLENDSKQLEAQFNQVAGAIIQTKAILADYLKTK